MKREEASKVYLDGLILKDVEISRFFEAARSLSKEDKDRIQLAIERYSTNMERINGEKKGGEKERCLVL